MRVELLEPDAAVPIEPRATDPGAFAKAVDSIGAELEGATSAEDAYANGTGSLQGAMYARARADVTISVATAAAQRAAQAITSILNIQV